MLRTNLSTRPFYNLRAVQIALGTAGAIVLTVTLFDIAQIVRLTMSQQSLGASAAEAEKEAVRLREEATRIRAQIDPQDLQIVSNAAREANQIIDQRAFSWTELFGRFESTLPPDVRITTVQPRVEREGAFVVAIGLEAKQAEDLDAFVEALETSGAFHNVLAIKEQSGATGLIEVIAEGTYVPPPRDTTTGSPQPAAVSRQSSGP